MPANGKGVVQVEGKGALVGSWMGPSFQVFWMYGVWRVWLQNIGYGKPSATMEEIVEAAKAANAHNFIMTFPDAYMTQVGEMGVQVGRESSTISPIPRRNR